MRPEFITVGTIVNAHGIRGEVKVNPAGFDPEFIADFKTMYIAGQPVKVKAARVHKSTVLLALPFWAAGGLLAAQLLGAKRTGKPLRCWVGPIRRS